MRSRWHVTVPVTAGLALLVGAPLAWLLAQPPATVGQVAAPTATSADVAMRQVSDPAPPPENEPPQPEPAPQGAHPERIVIDAIDVDHPVVPVGLEANGEMQIPHDVHEIGWYTGTHVRPGDPGSAVLAGHVDSRAQGRGAFFDLDHLQIDDHIVLTTDAGQQRWQVTGRTSYPKTTLPIDDIFTVDDQPRLVLITCGGPFDSDTRHYTHNTVVYAHPHDPA